jgi:hypothetical protein
MRRDDSGIVTLQQEARCPRALSFCRFRHRHESSASSKNWRRAGSQPAEIEYVEYPGLHHR